ncbi:MAG: ABC transporter substrate-binding protein [Gallionellales bacterium 35-53-114]|jgi:phosphonate transport system substrate-binding protein|nr:MAG: ABC transporter substrate-binding protein [Gallionellales bacterium 35-53-114]OYZ64922.1 MAG: ABC transporter substrate-binding protein [Gallionellales bacterium 24-53-125]OZB07541.1 MAG: ABC transporter substrate-binding protein [Gallionellales bacterium 39-52-133]HQS58786.1 PhnD/SsuA/transferrin family substrate-binding protein [Gallionellaceae bacterium]HQS75126.1 PhnD/SsuA/transferrin family substrate-binding protein [Gallionellaceae bacterium]
MPKLTKFLAILFILLSFTANASTDKQDLPLAPLRIGLTPVFLDDQAAFLNKWRDYLQHKLERPVIFVQRGSYREVVDLLRDGKLEFAWLCGYPYIRNKRQFHLVAVPLYQDEPVYHSYLIVPATDTKTTSLADLRGKVFAFSDPDSNSGYLYTAYLLAKQGAMPATYFSKSFYTWSHRKVVEAIAAGLAQGGSVDGYVWDTLSRTHPELTSRTRVVNESPKFGFPPIVSSRSVSKHDIASLQEVVTQMKYDKEGAYLLNEFNLNGFVPGNPHLFDSISDMYHFVEQMRTHAAP